jgi:hypothetical protein
VLVEFEDGERIVAPRFAVRPAGSSVSRKACSSY